MQRELQMAGNKFEILDFVKSRMKMSIGLQKAPIPVSILKDEEEEDESERDAQDEVKDPNVEGLPKKVDEFMSYINRVYFDGNLDNNGKELFKSDWMAMEREDWGDFDSDGSEIPTNSNKPRRKILITT